MTREMTLGARRLANWLNDRRMTNAEFAGKVSVAAHSVWRWTAGHSKPSFERAEQIAVATGGAVRVEDWMSDETRAALNERAP